MTFISGQTHEINSIFVNQMEKLEIHLREQKLEQITDQIIVRQINKKQKMDNGEIANPLPYYGNSLSLTTRAGQEIYEIRTQTIMPAFNLISLPQYRILKNEGFNGVFSLGPGFDENGIEILDLLMLQLFTNQESLIKKTKVLIEENYGIVRESTSKIFGRNQYLFSANSIK